MVVKPRPVRVYLPDRDLDTTRRRNVGFRGTCKCGWEGRRRTHYYMARADQREHQATAHANQPAPTS